jgi:hypothetical protein
LVVGGVAEIAGERELGLFVGLVVGEQLVFVEECVFVERFVEIVVVETPVELVVGRVVEAVRRLLRAPLLVVRVLGTIILLILATAAWRD